jgi:hypothetical protein
MEQKNKPRYNYFGMGGDRVIKNNEVQDNSFIGGFKTRNPGFTKIITSDNLNDKSYVVGKNHSIDMRNLKLVSNTPQHKDRVEEFLKNNFTKISDKAIKGLSKSKNGEGGGTNLATYLKHSKKVDETRLDDINKTSKSRPVTADKYDVKYDKYQHTRNSKHCSLNTSFIGSSSQNKGSHNNSYFFKSEEELTERTQEKIKVIYSCYT